MESSGHTDFVILTTTDMHGKCWDTDVVRESPQHNNMLRISSAVRKYRKEYGGNVLLIDNGDISGASPVSVLHTDDFTGAEGDIPPAMALCLKEMGYEVFVPGNHDFNHAWDNTAAVFRYLEEGGVRVTAANIYYDGTDGSHEKGAGAFSPYVIRKVNVCGREHRIGILGLTNTDNARWDPREHFPGMAFAHPCNSEYSVEDEAARYLPLMKAEGCEFIIVSYHGGIGDADAPLKAMINTENQGKRLIGGSADIDMLVAGHDHMPWYSNTYLKNKEGKDILVVNGGGRELTSTVVRFSEDHNGKLCYEIISSENLDPAEYEVDRELESLLCPYADQAEAFMDVPVGTAEGGWDRSRDHHFRQTDTMDLICACMLDISLRYTGIKPDMAMTPVTAGDHALSPGDVCVRDIYRMYSINNTLTVIPMYGRDIRAVLEENAVTRLRTETVDGTVILKINGDRFTNIITGGLNFAYDLDRPEGSRVIIDGFPDGRSFDDDGLYYVSTITYLIGNGRCGLRKCSINDALWIQDTTVTGTIQEYMTEYIREYCRKNGSITPDIADWRWSVQYKGKNTER